MTYGCPMEPRGDLSLSRSCPMEASDNLWLPHKCPTEPNGCPHLHLPAMPLCSYQLRISLSPWLCPPYTPRLPGCHPWSPSPQGTVPCPQPLLVPCPPFAPLSLWSPPGASLYPWAHGAVCGVGLTPSDPLMPCRVAVAVWCRSTRGPAPRVAASAGHLRHLLLACPHWYHPVGAPRWAPRDPF